MVNYGLAGQYIHHYDAVSLKRGRKWRENSGSRGRNHGWSALKLIFTAVFSLEILICCSKGIKDCKGDEKGDIIVGGRGVGEIIESLLKMF